MKSLSVLGVRALALGLVMSAMGLQAQQQGMEVSADMVLPQPPPTAPLGDWTVAAGREKVTLERGGGVVLRGWSFASAKAGAPTVLFFNDNDMTVDHSESLYRSIAAAGAQVVVFDYRGYGFSMGEAGVAAFRADAAAEYDFAVKRAGGPVVVYGFAMGTAIATSVAVQRPVKGMILAGTIASAAEEIPVYAKTQGLTDEDLKGIKLDAGVVEAFDLVGRVKKSKAPLLMLHGGADKMVPMAQGRKVFAASAAGEKKFVVLPGVGHQQTAGSAVGLKAVGMFLSGLK
ncbi:lysophospholipase [Granulicella sp. WH15]|uniref:alpha/beta hydrolase n=1 Tax=Granulicella sp. WH15 TaxID=2602070 RepID=UPI0013672293|nr:alpha/beta fold hydrolase [Granulicella sp. WH15]QHN02258.1 lysophospholipase [Granulicella sp. WH15]